MNTPRRPLVVGINLAIVVVAVLLGVVSVKKYLLTTTARTASRPPIVVGMNISIPDVDWSRKRRTMVLALQEGCRFCTESAPFYKRLVAKATGNGNLQLIAVLPQNPTEGRRYLDSLGVSIENVKRSELSKFGVSGTPTLLLLDDHGVVTAYWVGALSADQESEVLRRIGEVGLD